MASSDIKELSNCFSVASLQELVKEPILTIPQHYVRLDDQQQPDPNSLPNYGNGTRPLPAMITPTIDMAKLVSGVDDELEKLHSTCKEWGLFQVN